MSTIQCNEFYDSLRSQYKLCNSTYAYWFNKSADLLVSANVLWDAINIDSDLNIRCWSSYKMFMGLSFELLFKTICIKEKIDFKKIHNLATLAEKAEISLTSDEKKVFEVLTEYILWDGKYPTPIKEKSLECHWKNERELDETKLDFSNLVKIWQKYSASLHQDF
ncbi:TPA: hypothetical protein SMM80_002773 [Proteus mirabilis]|uniref:hypothetical protein n=1 Tax=Proteus mirabilis TaxID=584 RepID=UPI0018C724D2|nr:hypothetical protein [Proteus mirabilis]EME2733345.1 hypothetical protein [Proteus mirabilis]MBG5991011.1 hypothetical protein [Proteus mirabilis]MDO1711912.1 hypothetical protein [Proteus mirabilis]HCL6187314.1 hypothetical protein [Proteus mirabilis]HEJ9399162.1 hypothetical protein [Proteus mirabilis]